MPATLVLSQTVRCQNGREKKTADKERDTRRELDGHNGGG
jgi:hypothetical protein